MSESGPSRTARHLCLCAAVDGRTAVERTYCARVREPSHLGRDRAGRRPGSSRRS